MSTQELRARLEIALQRLEEARLRDAEEFQRRFELVRSLRAQLDERRERGGHR